MTTPEAALRTAIDALDEERRKIINELAELATRFRKIVRLHKAGRTTEAVSELAAACDFEHERMGHCETTEQLAEDLGLDARLADFDEQLAEWLERHGLAN